MSEPMLIRNTWVVRRKSLPCGRTVSQAGGDTWGVSFRARLAQTLVGVFGAYGYSGLLGAEEVVGERLQ
ncbi:hypothetical protein GCM10009019_11280 [Salarchaeum japonicum]|uniref:Uncharacterized protein n=1 Tax=Salarchaeum japonicum TaxID=555573 RepID=A0AAV3T0E9_9EURY